MAKEFLYLHWRAVRLGLIPIMLAAFGVPLIMVQGLGRPEGMTDGFYASFILDGMSPKLLLFPITAAITGISLALTAWTWDHEMRHVYSLSLPLSRPQYALYKFGAGAVLALLPTAALLVGTVVASSSMTLPATLAAYPLAVTTRFLFSLLLVYAITFAFAAGSIRTTVIALTSWVVLLTIGNSVVNSFGSLIGEPGLMTFNFTYWVLQVVTSWPGPLHMLTGNWALIDV